MQEAGTVAANACGGFLGEYWNFENWAIEKVTQLHGCIRAVELHTFKK